MDGGNSPMGPTSWADIGKIILAGSLFVVFCVTLVVGVIAEILGYFSFSNLFN